MTDFKLLQQALDALEFPHDSEWSNKAKAIKALQHALAQPEFDTPESHIVKWSIPVDPNNFGEPLAQPEHPLDKKADNARELGLDYEVEQEPVAWMVLTQDDKKLMLWGQEKPPIFDAPVKLIPLYTAPQKYCPSENNAAYEKGFVEGMAKQMHSSVDHAVNAMTKPWVGLTDDEILSAAEEVPITCIRQRDYDLHFAPIIEAKLKEKNNAV